MPATNRTKIDDCEEFDAIFERLTGVNPIDVKVVDEDGFLFVPLSTNLSQKPRDLRKRICELAGPNGWRNHVVGNEHKGWWIKKPS